MIVVKMELWPGGDKSKAKLLGLARISNDGSGTQRSGNYHYKLFGNNGVAMNSGRVTGFPRQRYHAWNLLLKVLRDARHVV